jgi:alpha-tubulin suppressor-like RCC1 family protein
MNPRSPLSRGLVLGALVTSVLTTGAQPVTRISAGSAHSLFLKSDGSLWGVGGNWDGQLGDGSYNDTNHPEQIVASNVTVIAAGSVHSLFLKSDGSLWAMGHNGSYGQYGALGDGTYDNTNRPEQIVASQVTAIAGGGDYSLFLKNDGSLWGMGYNAYGQLGDGIARTYPLIGTNRPEQIVASGVTAIGTGGNHSLFLKSNGSLWAMGDNGSGQLGDGTYNSGSYDVGTVPEQIVAGGVAAIAAAFYHSLFLKSDGSLWGMGENYYGQLGDGNFVTNYPYGTNQPEPIVAGNVIAIAAGGRHSLFLKNDGSLWAMGLNNYGQLGDGTLNNANHPVRIVASGVTAIAAGSEQSLFLKSDGSLWSMGRNEYGQLGLGTSDIAEAHVPVQIVPLVIPVSFYAANLVANGGFETGDFSGWNLSGNATPDTLVSTKSGYVHSGNYGAQCGPVGSLVYLSQSLPTIPGITYLLSFWLNSPDGVTPNEFVLSCNGATLLDKTNLAAIGWTNLQFAVTAITTSTMLQFGFRDDNTYLGLDNVSLTRIVQPAITGISLSKPNLVLTSKNGLYGVTYRTLMGTNLTQPLNQWLPVATNVLGADGNFTITVTNTVSPAIPKRFYILQAQ